MRQKMLGRALFALLATFVLVSSFLSAPTANADRAELERAKQRVRQLETEASEITEQYAEAKIKLDDGKRRVSQLEKDIAEQATIVEQLDADARLIVLVQFQNRNIDPSLRLFSDADPESLLGQISTANKIGENLNNTLQEQQLQQAALAGMRRTLDAEVEALAAEKKRLAKLETDINQRITEAKGLVDRLKLRELMNAEDGGSSKSTPTPTTPTAPTAPTPTKVSDGNVNSKVQGAINYALSKVKGGRYSWGGAGPNGFDCSGLTLSAYRSVGISLPHSSQAQSRIGRPVSRSELKPGDLIFWYRPIHHVGLYIGGGKIVHARNTRSGIVVQSLNSYPAPYAGARRVVG
ncbi:MAG: NlpC/P60 family protein [Propionibacteriaceae bacterium]|nr:NlpC/P60 family protein [Propionibacteriaceae bacterium]